MQPRIKHLIQFFLDNPKELPECGIYDCRSLIRDEVTTIYKCEGIQVDACYFWDYIEIFGLTADEFDSVYKILNALADLHYGE